MSETKRYTLSDISEDQFFKLPKFLFQDNFISMSCEAKLLYSLLKDRHSLSVKNGWYNNSGEVFMIYTREEMATMLGVSINTARKAFKILSEYRLVSEERQGLSKPNRIFLLTPNLLFKLTRNICTSRSAEFECQEVQNLHPSKTDSIETDYSNTDTLTISRKLSIGFEELDDVSKVIVTVYQEIFKEPHRAITKTYEWEDLQDVDALYDEIHEYMFNAYNTNTVQRAKRICTVDYINQIQARMNSGYLSE